MVFDLLLSREWTKRPLGDLKRPKQSRRRLCWTIVGPKSKSRGAQDRSKTQKNERQHWQTRVLSLIAPLAGDRSQLGLVWVDCGSMVGRCGGRCWVDFESVCLSVWLSLSVCHPDIQRRLPNSTAWRSSRSD